MNRAFTYGFSLSLLTALVLAQNAFAVGGMKWFKEQTSWGYLSAEQKASPTRGKCTQVPVVMDIRNSANFPGPAAEIAIADDFGNVIGYDEVAKGSITNGKQVRQLKVCTSAHSWTHPSGNRTVSVTPFRKGERYQLVFANWLSNEILDSVDYTFLRK